jgi:hypothetical protein
MDSFAAIGSFLTGVMVTWFASALTIRRDREADWRKLRFEVYREYVIALSGIVAGRGNIAEHARYADSVNSMRLIAPASVLNALSNFLRFTSEQNTSQPIEEHDRLVDTLIAAMRRDVHLSLTRGHFHETFRLQAIPTGNPSAAAPISS